jgi:hypothetical protein
MFESIDIRRSDVVVPNTNVIYLFTVVSASYMLPWTAMGALLHYYAGQYGDAFFVYLNVAFYGVGLPLSYTQKLMDNYYDLTMGSKFMFRRRLWIAMSILFVTLLFGPYAGEMGTILMVIVVGLTTWSAHGCACTLASVVKLNSSTMQQIGFVLPGLYSVVAVTVLDMEGDVPEWRLRLFFWMTAAGVLPGIAAWYVLCQSDLVRVALERKDHTMSGMLIEQHMGQQEMGTASPVTERSNVTAGSGQSGSHSAGSEDDEEYATSCTMADASDRHPLMLSQNKESILAYSRDLLKDRPSLLDAAIDGDSIAAPLLLHRWTLFLTIFISILQGSLLSYTCGAELWGEALPPLLYFVRIFSDLFGRPLALLPRPYIFSSIEWVCYASAVRVVVSFYFFWTIAHITPDPERLVWNTEDSLILVSFQVIFSLFSGYLNCLTYEYSSEVFKEDWQRLVAAQYLNLTFQKACTFGVATAITVVFIINYANPV